MDRNVCIFVLTCVYITQSTGLLMTYPGVNGMVEINENKTNNILNCSEFASYSRMGSTLTWQLKLPTSEQTVGTCFYYGSCTSRSDVGYTASRPATDVSMMAIDPTKNVAWVQNGAIGCYLDFTSTAVNNLIVSLPMDLIYPPEIESCRAQANTSSTPWTVSVRCSISKTYSSRGRYSCQWYRKQGLSIETAMGPPASFNTVPLCNTSHHVSGSCDVTFPLPSDGLYSYRVVVSPGSVSKEAGEIKIRKPSASHNCPQYTVENQNVNCTCGGDVGSPPGIPQWSNGYTQLTLTKLHISQNGTQFRCQAVWNGGVVHEAVYTLFVLTLYVPSITQFTLNSQRGNLSVAETEYVTFSCGATGRPTPDTQIINSEGVVSSASKGGEVTPTMTVQWLNLTVPAQCQHTGIYWCTGSNPAGTGTSKSATLFVNCKTDNTEVNIAAIVGGAAGGVVVLVVITVVVIVCYFRKRTLGGDRAYDSADNGQGKEESKVYTELRSISKNDTSSPQSVAPALPAPRNPYVTEIPEQYQNAAFEPSNGAPALQAPKNPPVTEITEAADGNNDDQGMYEEAGHNLGVTDTDTGTETGPSGSTMYIEMSPGQQI